MMDILIVRLLSSDCPGFVSLCLASPTFGKISNSTNIPELKRLLRPPLLLLLLQFCLLLFLLQALVAHAKI